jgi:hypothetical protein
VFLATDAGWNGFLAVADFNSDGNPDLLVGNAPSLLLLLGSGDGGFSVQQDLDVSSALGTGADAGAQELSGFKAFDVDGDGNQDLIFSIVDATGNQGWLVWMKGNGDRRFGRQRFWAAL